MTRRRWLVDGVEGTRAWLTGEHAAHLARVLRARVGQEFDLATPQGVFIGRVVSSKEDRVEFELGDPVSAFVLPEVTVLLAVFKFDRMEWAIEKATELGVANIVPIVASRTEKHLAAAAEKRVERWRRIAVQAAEQSRRAGPPKIVDSCRLDQALTASGATRLVLAESETQLPLTQALLSHPAGGAVALAVGPEGGWTADEIRSFHRAGWTSASLGPTILRAETAAIAALSVVMAELQ
jgi:16S rRNA (uracil1498-N3)-methyltransferase